MTLEDKSKCEEKKPEESKDILKLIKQFPVKPFKIIREYHSYTIEGPVMYNSYPSM